MNQGLTLQERSFSDLKPLQNSVPEPTWGPSYILLQPEANCTWKRQEASGFFKGKMFYSQHIQKKSTGPARRVRFILLY